MLSTACRPEAAFAPAGGKEVLTPAAADEMARDNILGSYVVKLVDGVPPVINIEGHQPTIMISKERIHFQSQCIYADWTYKRDGEAISTDSYYKPGSAMCARALAPGETAIQDAFKKATVLRRNRSGLYLEGGKNRLELHRIVDLPATHEPRKVPPGEAPLSRRRATDAQHAPPRAPRNPVLARMLAAASPYQAYRQPCIAKKETGTPITNHQRRRQREVWSDSLELQKRIRDSHGHRLLSMAPDFSGGHDKARFFVRVTGYERLPAYRLGGRARDVPVIVQYGMPYTAEELSQMAHEKASEAIQRLLPDMQGSSVSTGQGLGILHIFVHSPNAEPPPNLTELCERLVDAAGMPVLLTFVSTRMTDFGTRP